ncbi:uncharacterized protein [Elaeis guineensis]|uniref:Agamous-like MADS-box protein AGL53 n=1 Tax=Elaeis guineensis var. tenera TaxID=51953 RepID=A0A6J0PCV0_ELAGV|nr:agamous-like MADS-box protein AGL53 [Elaeis guineensis]
MVGKKLNVEFIKHRKKRLATYRRRKEALKQAAYELSTLCGTPTAVIYFGPDGQPESWPEDEGAVRDIIGRHPGLGAKKRSTRPFDLRDLPPFDDTSEEFLREMLCSMESGMEAVKERIQLLKKDSRCNQGDFHGDTGGVQQQGCQCNNPAFMEECFDVPMVSKAAMDDGPGQGHGAFAPMELKQVEGVAADAFLPCSSNASMDFNDELAAFSMPLIFMPPPFTGATSEHDIACIWQ